MAKILIIDDDKQILKLVQRILQNDSHELEVYQSFEETGMAQAAKYDLIILDVMMPQRKEPE